jgi:hypothetical protein
MACRPVARVETFHSRFKAIDLRKRGSLVSDTSLLIAVAPIGLFGVSVKTRQACPYS